jgi:hypothetical protein
MIFEHSDAQRAQDAQGQVALGVLDFSADVATASKPGNDRAAAAAAGAEA